MLVLEGLHKRFGTVEALADLSLEVREGELLTVLGASGSGKSTALRVVAGLETADAGHVRIAGRDVSAVPPGDRGVAMVFQSFALFPHMTVEENIGFGLRARRTDAQEAARRVREAAGVLDLADRLQRRPGELSGGERQRVALARALAGRPRVLLLDEPLSNLDAPLRVRARAEIRRLHERTGATIVHVTHDQAEALSLGHRVAVMDGGRVRQVGEPDVVYDHPADTVVAGFVGTPPMTLVDVVVDGGILRGEHGLVLPVPPGTSDAAGTRLIAGFRAEDVRVAGDGEDGAVFDAVVEVVERAGHERLWLVRVGDRTFGARPDAAVPAAGASVRLAIAPSGVRLYLPQDGSAR